MEKVSIYQKIKNSLKADPTLPYQFQNIYEAGRRDIIGAVWENRNSYMEQENKAYQLIEEIKKSMEYEIVTKSFADYVIEYPVFQYLTKFSSILLDHIAEGVIDEQQLYRFGLQLTAKSSEIEQVKIGMVILGLYETEVAKNLIRVLGYHSEFTLYALEASNSYGDRNEFVFDLAKHTRGYGRIAAVQLLQPITTEQKQWFLEEGGDNEVIANLSCVICLCKTGLRSYFDEVNIDEDMFSCISYLFAYAFEKDSNQLYQNCTRLVERYVDLAKEYAEDILDLIALCMIESNQPNDQCKEVLNQPKWEQLVLEEMKYGNVDIIEFLDVILTVLDLKPDFSEFEPLLKRAPFDLDILKFLLEQHPRHYWKDIYCYLQEVLPIEVLEGEKMEVEDEKLSAEYAPDLWLYFLLFALRSIGVFQEKLVLSALNARYQPVRKEAITLLEQYETQCQLDIRGYLKEAKQSEPSKKLRERIDKLLKRKEGGYHES